MTNNLANSVKNLPNSPGVYRFFNKQGELIYVGKAKNLKNRVSSYFSKQKYESAKTKMLVSKIDRLEFVVVETEQDALFLENNMIKEHKPKYNVQLKDDKTYPWICIKNEEFPRVFSTRKKIKDGSKYFGPYSSVRTVKTLLELIKQVYPIRTCNLKLSEENTNANKFKVCLEYHIGNCKGPCVDYTQKAEYDQFIDEIAFILQGKIGSVIKRLKSMMGQAVENLEFEKAQIFKSKLERLENYQSKSTVVSPVISNLDVVSLVTDINHAFVNYFHVVDGGIVNSHTLKIKKKLEESDSELLEIGIAELRSRFKSNAREILVPFLPEFGEGDVKYTVPQRGDKKHLLDLSLRNAKYFMLDQHKKQQLVDPNKATNRVLETIKKDFRLPDLPVHIECFDNSNFQGTNAVAACVVFKNAKPSKKDYRHFNIKTVVGPDDFASMEEVVYRRYKRLLDEDQDLPQLIVIDGGKGQLSAACKSLHKLDLFGKIAIVGIAKKLEEIYFPGDSIPVYIDKRSESLKVIQQLRNEAHRFGITHHRNKRSKGAIQSELTSIPGIGEKTMEKLIKHFGSVKRLKSAASEDIEKLVGKSKTQLLQSHFSKASA